MSAESSVQTPPAPGELAAGDPAARDRDPAAREPASDAPAERGPAGREPAKGDPAKGEPRREPRREGDLRTAVLDAARQLLVREGYRDLSMRDVARAVGCSVSSIYLYFAGKDALVHALMDEGFERWHRRMREVAGAEPTPAARLEAVCRAYVEFGLANPEFYEIMYMFHSDRMARYPRELFRRARRNLEELGALAAAYAESVGAPAGEAGGGPAADGPDAQVRATALWATLHGIVSTIIADRLDRRLDRARYVEGAIRYALAGVRGATAVGQPAG
jgi:AcrR family transcriptional regulator